MVDHIVIGIDEVGRGSWAGPLVVGAVTLKAPLEGLRDSKQLTKRQRERLSRRIHDVAACGLGWVSAAELDTLGMTAALRLAAERALAALPTDYDVIILDGSYNFLSHLPRSQAIVKADSTVPAVSAASIIAKVARDAYMSEMAVVHPQYGFERHVGYGTVAHALALKTYGPCVLHRHSFAPIRLALREASVVTG